MPYPGFSEEELQVSTTEDAVVFDVAGNVHCAGSVHGAMDLHVVVDCIQVFLFVLEQTGRQLFPPIIPYERSITKDPPAKLLL